MKCHAVVILFLGMILALVPVSVGAQELPDSLFLEFDFEGFGNLVMSSPPLYSGDIYAGSSAVVGGTWWMQIDDSTWPPVTDPATRWDYIFNNYFVYSGQTGSWTAKFDATTLPTKPIWEISHPVNGTMGGTLIISFTFGDWDMDGILDIEEQMFGTFSGTMLVMKYGTGNFYKYCGSGAYNGACQNADPANFVDDYVEGHCILDLINCQIGVRPATWSSIKIIGN